MANRGLRKPITVTVFCKMSLREPITVTVFCKTSLREPITVTVFCRMSLRKPITVTVFCRMSLKEPITVTVFNRKNAKICKKRWAVLLKTRARHAKHPPFSYNCLDIVLICFLRNAFKRAWRRLCRDDTACARFRISPDKVFSLGLWLSGQYI